jgi:predicted phage terminase large subunit-like protein
MSTALAPANASVAKATLAVPRSSLDVVITCDPAISEKSSACRTAITVAGMTPYQKIFLLEYWVGRQGDPAKIIDQLLDLASFWQPRCIGVEAVAFQQALEPYIRREMASRGQHYVLLMLKPDRNEKKDQRILSLQPYFRAGQIYIQRGMFEFIEEYETFPLGRTRDILDAFSYAVRLLVPRNPAKKPGLEQRLKELESRDPASARYWRADAVRRGLIEAEPDLLDEMDEIEVPATEAGIGEFV